MIKNSILTGFPPETRGNDRVAKIQRHHKNTFRAFFAIDLPTDIKETIVFATKPLHALHSSKQIKWVKPENLHLTLCFMGNITFDQYEHIHHKIKKIIPTLKSFPLEFTTLKPFPSEKKFHIVSLQPETLPPIKKLAAIINQKVSSSGIQLERRQFKPHLTIGRINNQHKVSQKIFSKIEFPPISFTVTEIKLYKSEPKPEGSVYTQIAVYHFA